MTQGVSKCVQYHDNIGLKAQRIIETMSTKYNNQLHILDVTCIDIPYIHKFIFKY